MSESKPRFSTGIRFLDTELGGGIRAGTIVVLTAPPDSQSELLFEELARAQDLIYVSTTCRDEAELAERIEPSGFEQSGDAAVRYVSPDRLLNDPKQFAEDIPAEACLVVDPVTELEAAERNQYLSFLNACKRRLRAVDSIAVFHSLASDHTPEQRPLSLKRADQVWHLRQSVESETINTTLLVPKSRGDRALTEPISIELADEVRIDTSRNIA